MNPPGHTEKSALRGYFREQRGRFAGRRPDSSAQIRAHVTRERLWQEARSVLLFAPLPDEPDIWPLLAEALRLGKLAALPRFSRADDGYAPCRVSQIDCDVRPGYYGIREPTLECPPLDLKRLDLILVPGVGFGLNGGRLGRGKGYYDRLLEKIDGWKCGVAFDWQVIPEIPGELHDVCMDSLVTPTRWQVIARPVGSKHE